MSFTFHSAIRLVDGGELIPHVYREEYDNLICDDFFLDKISEEIQIFYQIYCFDDDFYDIYNGIKEKEFEDEMNAVEFFIVLKVLLDNKEILVEGGWIKS